MNPFPDPENWIEIPGFTARVHKSDQRPCAQCKLTTFSIVVVRRPGPADETGRPTWTEDFSVECPRCPMVSRHRGDVRTVIGKIDTRQGKIIEWQTESRNAYATPNNNNNNNASSACEAGRK